MHPIQTWILFCRNHRKRNAQRKPHVAIVGGNVLLPGLLRRCGGRHPLEKMVGPQERFQGCGRLNCSRFRGSWAALKRQTQSKQRSSTCYV